MKKIFIVFVFIFLGAVGVEAGNLQDVIAQQQMLQLQNDRATQNNYTNGANNFINSFTQARENKRRQREAEVAYQRQLEIERRRSATIRQQQKLEQMKMKRESVEQQNNIDKRLEKQKALCRVTHDDCEEVFWLGVDVMNNDSDYEAMFNKKFESGVGFDMAEFVYKLGKLHPKYGVKK
jgi:ABC-type proline/glycine betaine transport system ATPase subunit